MANCSQRSFSARHGKTRCSAALSNPIQDRVACGKRNVHIPKTKVSASPKHPLRLAVSPRPPLLLVSMMPSSTVMPFLRRPFRAKNDDIPAATLVFSINIAFEHRRNALPTPSFPCPGPSCIACVLPFAANGKLHRRVHWMWVLVRQRAVFDYLFAAASKGRQSRVDVVAVIIDAGKQGWWAMGGGCRTCVGAPAWSFCLVLLALPKRASHEYVARLDFGKVYILL